MMTGPIVETPEEHFLTKYKNFYKMGISLNWNLNSYETTILKNGYVSILGTDKYYKPIILIDLEIFPKILEPALLTIILKILALVRMKMHIPKKVEASKIILNIEGKNLISNGKLVKDLLICLDIFQHQYDELLILKPSWSIQQLISFIKKLGMNNDYENKIKLLRTKEEICENFGKLLNSKFIPKKFGGSRQKG